MQRRTNYKDHCSACEELSHKRDKSLSVSIPSGVDNGDKVRLSGEGSAAKGGHIGDLYVAISFQNEIFEEGRDLTLKLQFHLKLLF